MGCCKKVLIFFGVCFGALTGILFAAQRYVKKNVLYPGYGFKSNEYHNEFYVDVIEAGEFVNFNSEDGTALQGFFKPSDSSDSSEVATILFFHGNGGDLINHLGHLTAIDQLYMVANTERTTFNFFIIDYRGYGESEGLPSESGLIKDAKAALAWLRTEMNDVVDLSRIIVYGHSLGGAVATGLVSELEDADNQIAALVLENTFTEIGDVVENKVVDVLQNPSLQRLALPIVKLLLWDTWRSNERIQNIRVPVGFVTGQLDQLIPHEQMDELFDLATSTRLKEKFEYPYGTHMNTLPEPHIWSPASSQQQTLRLLQFLDNARVYE